MVLALWLLALVGSFVLSAAVGTDFSTKFQLPNTQSAKALNLLEKDFPSASGSSDQIVLYAPSGTLRVISCSRHPCGTCHRTPHRIGA